MHICLFPKFIPLHLKEGMHQPQPIPTNSATQPTVIIAPKFFNGNGSDNSTSELPSEANDRNHNIMSEPSMVIKSNVDTTNSKTEENDANNVIDFSKGLVIKKTRTIKLI